MAVAAVVVVIALYFVPIAIAGYRHSRNTALVALFSLVFGFTVIGWIVGLVLAFTGANQAQPRRHRATHSSFSTNDARTSGWKPLERVRCSACRNGWARCPSSMCRNGYLYTGGSSYSGQCTTCGGRGEVRCGVCNGTGFA